MGSDGQKVRFVIHIQVGTLTLTQQSQNERRRRRRRRRCRLFHSLYQPNLSSTAGAL